MSRSNSLIVVHVNNTRDIKHLLTNDRLVGYNLLLFCERFDRFNDDGVHGWIIEPLIPGENYCTTVVVCGK